MSMNMNTEIEQKVNELVELVRKNHPERAVCFELSVNYKEHEVAFIFKGPHIDSMRNLSGNWIE